jgi:type IV pilus assembly protein PilC
MAKNRVVRLESEELAWFCEQIALVQKSGIGISEGIPLLSESTDQPRQLAVLKALSERVADHVPLSQAMNDIGGFPQYMLKMTEIGEVSGNLDNVMTNLSEFYHRDAELRRRLRSSMIYPLVLLFMMAAVIVLLIVRVLPVFNEILSTFGGDMPAFTSGLLRFGIFLGNSWFWLLPLLILAVLVIWFLLSRSRGRIWLEKIKTGAPLLGPLYRQIHAARFALALSYLISSGIDLDTSLLMTEGMLDSDLIRSRIKQCREKIAAGSDPFSALQETELFPRIFSRMLALGSRTGVLDQVMGKIARTYETDVQNKLTRLTGLIEPLLVVILSIIVGAILLTVMLPLIEIMSSIG